MPDARGHIKGISVPRVPWHSDIQPGPAGRDARYEAIAHGFRALDRMTRTLLSESEMRECLRVESDEDLPD